MNYSKKEIQNMSEKDFRVKVLIPLFIKMDFQDVNHYHGINEQGKDIIMWKIDETGTRLYYAVVVKASKITGQAKGKNSANEVCFQVQQSLSQAFKDKIDGSNKTADIIWVVCNNVIRNEAIESIADINKDRIIRYFDLDKIFELYQKYLPDHPIDKIIATSSELDNISPNWRVGIHTSGDKVFFFPVPKHEYADKVEPLEFSVTFQPDLIIEGIPILDILSNPSDFSGPFLIPKEGLSINYASEFLKKAMNFDDPKNNFMIIPQKKLQPTIIVKFVDYQGNEYLLDDIEILDITTVDNKTIASNLSQKTPYDLTVTTIDNKLDDITIKVHKYGYHFDDILKGYRFLRAISNGGILFLINKYTNDILIQKNISHRSQNEVGFTFIDVLELISFIQIKTNQKIFLPDRDITVSEIFTIRCVGNLIKGNIILASDFDTFHIDISMEKAKEILEQIENVASISYYTFINNYEEKILENRIDLGKVHFYCDAVTFFEDDKLSITNQIDMNQENIQVVFRPLNNSNLVQFYENYDNTGFVFTEENIRKLMLDFPCKYRVES